MNVNIHRMKTDSFSSSFPKNMNAFNERQHCTGSQCRGAEEPHAAPELRASDPWPRAMNYIYSNSLYNSHKSLQIQQKTVYVELQSRHFQQLPEALQTTSSSFHSGAGTLSTTQPRHHQARGEATSPPAQPCRHSQSACSHRQCELVRNIPATF